MTDLLSRLSAGRFQCDNEEVLRWLGFDDIAGGTPEQPTVWGNGADYHVDPKPLDSLDDALRLVPEGWRTYRAGNMHGPWFWVLDRSPGQFYTVEGEAPTAAVALTIAILRAHHRPEGD